MMTGFQTGTNEPSLKESGNHCGSIYKLHYSAKLKIGKWVWMVLGSLIPKKNYLNSRKLEKKHIKRHNELLVNCIFGLFIIIIFFNIIEFEPTYPFHWNVDNLLPKIIFDVLIFIVITIYLNKLIMIDDEKVRKYYDYIRCFSMPVGILAFIIMLTNSYFLYELRDHIWIVMQIIFTSLLILYISVIIYLNSIEKIDMESENQ